MVGLPPPSAIATSHNVIGYFTWWADRVPERPGIVFPGHDPAGELVYDVVTYGDLERDVARTMASLRALGLQQGDRVLLMIPMSRGLYTLLMAVLALGATAVFVDPWVPLQQIGRAAALVEPQAFAGIPKAHLLRLLSEPFRRIPIHLVAQGGRWAGLLGARVEALSEGSAERIEVATCRPDDTALITFTTGSTGTPKGSNRTHAFLDAQARALEHHLPRRAGDVDMPALPVFVLNNLSLGIPSVLPLVDFRRIADVDPTVVVREIEEWEVTTIGGSPAYLQPIAHHLRRQGRTLARVRSVVTGGAPVSPALLRALHEAVPGARGDVRVLYGSTEAEPVGWIEADEVLAETAALTEAGRGNCVGRAVPDVDLKIVRAVPGPWQLDGRGWSAVEVVRGEVGEVLVTGDHVQRHYFRNPAAEHRNKVRGPDGRVWHRMGDLAYMDAKDRLWLVGRIDDAVRVGERVLYPIQVEARAETVPGVVRAGLLARDGRAVLAVSTTADAPADVAERVRRACAEADLAVDEVRLIPEVPTDPRHNAKVDRRALREILDATRV